MIKSTRYVQILLLFALAASALGGFPSAGRAAQLGTAQFRQDLQFFARELPRRHKNAFHYSTREQFQTAVEELDSKLNDLDEDGFFVGLMRVMAMIGDSHSHPGLPPETESEYPIVIQNITEAYRVMQVLPGYEKALGTHVVKIDDTPADRFYPILSRLATQNENPNYAPALVSVYLRTSNILHGAGIAAKSDTARFTFEDDSGQQFALDLPAIPSAKYKDAKWIPFGERLLNRIGEPMHNATPTFSFTYISSSRTVYASIRQMVDVAEPAKQLFQFIRERQPDKLVIDLRQNPGGNYFHGLHGLIEPIAKMPGVNRKGHLFVLIGALTGSAAIANSSQFHTMTQAILVGQPIGAKPAEYSERGSMTLPNTRILVYYSIRFYDFSYNGENVIRPDQEIKTTWDDVKNGRLPVLQWCLDYKN
ncbi:MAG TPA: hypothetical protein VFO34_01600 [Candidatus Acidoferrales bacterium]|nr:hypothetical protein [Candidatus Acidoferrales bacterium]